VQTSMSAAERGQWDAAGIAPLEGSFLSWSAREAMAKALRCGLTLPLELLALAELTVGAGGIHAVFPNFPQYAVRAWVTGGFALALVTPRRSAVALVVPDEVGAALAASAASFRPAGAEAAGSL
jgi:4'-phosphopantetheinyl transferase